MFYHSKLTFYISRYRNLSLRPSKENFTSTIQATRDNTISQEMNMSSQWNQGLCNCCGDIESCLCGTFCSPCLAYRNAESIDEPGWLYCLLSCTHALPAPMWMLRRLTREKYNIEGSSLEDAAAAFCCPCCLNVQLGAEHKARGELKLAGTAEIKSHFGL